MHIDVAELLRCPVAHEDTWLVARVDRMAGRHIVDGALGCPICAGGSESRWAMARAVASACSAGEGSWKAATCAAGRGASRSPQARATASHKV